MKIIVVIFLVVGQVVGQFAGPYLGKCYAKTIENNSNEVFSFKNKRLFWKGSTYRNHYYYDFNGDKIIDAFDVIHSKGVDYYSHRVKGIYYQKHQIILRDNTIQELGFERKNNKWIKKYQKESTREAFAKDLLKTRNVSQLEHVSDEIITGLSCLGMKSDRTFWAQKILNRLTSSDNKKINKETQTGNEFYKLLQITDIVDSNEDVSYACAQCCTGYNTIACKLCSSVGIEKNNNQSIEYDLYSLFTFADKIDPSKRLTSYHNALENIHARLNNYKQIEVLVDLFNGKKELLLEKLYFQFASHMNKDVNELSGNKLYYSDMIAELMSKVYCFDKESQLNPKKIQNCEVMYLARSIPESYCFNRKRKTNCRKMVRGSYAQRKALNQKGIRIPANFKRLQ